MYITTFLHFTVEIRKEEEEAIPEVCLFPRRSYHRYSKNILLQLSF